MEYSLRGKRKEQLTAYLFLAPALLIIATFVLFPILKLFYLGFTDNQLIGKTTNFVGLANFTRAFGDPLFIKSMGNAGYFSIVVVPVQTFLAMIVAVIANYKLRGFKYFQTIYFFPVVTSFVSVCIIWRLMYDGSFGLVSSVLQAVGINNQGFLTNPDTAMNAMIVTCIWKSFGYYMTIFLAGLQQIPGEIYESSQIDGVNFWTKFIYITFPMLKKTTLFVLVITTIDAMRIYIPAFVMTSGGPMDSTNVIVYHIWITAFKLMDVGYASAMALLLFVVIMLITALQFRVMQDDK